MQQSFNRKSMSSLERKYNFKAAKELGQNFVTDPAVTENIIESAGAGKKDLIIEIGPGLGVITARAAENCGKLVAIEVDKNLLPILAETVGWQPNVKIINEDILKADLADIIYKEKVLPDGSEAEHVKLIGNLPYYITSPIMAKLMENRGLYESVTIMVQKEVAEKMMAMPGKRNYGVMSVAIQYFCDIEYVMDVPKEVFMPQPKVDSSVLTLHIRREKPVQAKDEDKFFRVVKAGFAQRRKTLGNALVGTDGADKAKVQEVLNAAGVDPMRRAETLSLAEFAAISDNL